MLCVVNGLGLTLHANVNPIMKFIYIHVSVNIKYEKCKRKIL
jgi:hypothetical protein